MIFCRLRSEAFDLDQSALSGQLRRSSAPWTKPSARAAPLKAAHLLALENAEPLGNGDKLSQGLHVHFFHDHFPMRLDRSLSAAKFARGVLVCLPVR
jgi:hypothetical protein